MALDQVEKRYKKYVPKEKGFYSKYYYYVIIVMMVLILLAGTTLGVVLYQILKRPLPIFTAIQPDRDKLLLTPFKEPNLLPDTIIRFASKAATLAYTFDLANYNQQIQLARPYFTERGWQAYLQSAQRVIQTVVERQLLVYGVVSGTPVVSNEGPLPDTGYTWRVQIPFLVTYVAGEVGAVSTRNYYVVVTLIRVPTTTNPQGIGIDQFIMR